MEKCRRGRYQPLLLLYATPCGTPVNTESAPKSVTVFIDPPGAKKPLQNTRLRSVTPNPEKPGQVNNVNQLQARRAITPNPELNQQQQQQQQQQIRTNSYPRRPPYHAMSDYQNLTEIQKNILYNRPQQQQMNGNGVDAVDGGQTELDPAYVSRRQVDNILVMQKRQQQQVQLTRSLSNGSNMLPPSHQPQQQQMIHDGISIPDHLNVPRRRDSGNWSGDRNSASSSSSTTMDNPYMYIVNKMQKNNVLPMPKSPTTKSGELSSSSSGHYDAGYDSYSLSSTDSLPLQQGLKHNLQV